jgi:hypothetical protein
MSRASAVGAQLRAQNLGAAEAAARLRYSYDALAAQQAEAAMRAAAEREAAAARLMAAREDALSQLAGRRDAVAEDRRQFDERLALEKRKQDFFENLQNLKLSAPEAAPADDGVMDLPSEAEPILSPDGSILGYGVRTSRTGRQILPVPRSDDGRLSDRDKFRLRALSSEADRLRSVIMLAGRNAEKKRAAEGELAGINRQIESILSTKPSTSPAPPPDGMPLRFGSVAEAEAANLPRGTRIQVYDNGRWRSATVQ